MIFNNSTKVVWIITILLCLNLGCRNSPTDHLVEASEHGNVSEIAMLLKRGANVNSKTRMGRTALIAASERGNLEAVALLLRSGADTEEKNYSDQTALIVAAEN